MARTRIPTLRTLLVLVQAAAIVSSVRIALWLVPFPDLRSVVTFLTSRNYQPTSDTSADDLSWAVQAVARYVPHATCLTQAISLHILLKRRGLESQIRIGVRKEIGSFEAHAWVESRGRVLIGIHEVSSYTPIMVWK